MIIANLYSRKLKLENGGYADIYQYEFLPTHLCEQLRYIFTSGIGGVDDNVSRPIYQNIEESLLREYGLPYLSVGKNAVERVYNYLKTPNGAVDRKLDIVQLSCMAMENHAILSKKAKTHINELNIRFKEAGVGYKYEAGQIIRIDSEFIHSEVVKPALAFLSEPHLAGAQDEFLSAHAHYRSNNFKECLVDCLKAFESTMKGVCARRGWTHDPKATAKTLLDFLFEKKLVPDIMQSHFSGLRSTLEAGVPTVRNRMAGHGQGHTPVAVPGSIASYVLHLTATNIVFLAKLDSEAP
jgi:hypothetical protein